MTDPIWIISSCALIVAVIAIRAVFGKRMSAGLRYALWGLVLLRLLIPGTVFQSPVSVETAVNRNEIVRDMEALRQVSSITQTESGSVVGRMSGVQSGQNEAAVGEAGQGSKVILQEAAPERFRRMQRTLEVRDLLRVVYFAGMAVTAAWFITANLRFYLRIRRRRKRINAGTRFPVYLAEGIESSCLFINSVYVSKQIAEDAEKFRYVLAHESAHRRHGDGFIALLRAAALVIHWYDPLVWVAAFLSRRDSELFADAGAIAEVGEENRGSYGEALIELSSGRSSRAPIACAATMMTGGKAELKRRIKGIASHRKTGAVLAAVVLAAALAAAGCAFLGGKAGETPASDTPSPTEETAVQPTETKLFSELPMDEIIAVFERYGVPLPYDPRENEDRFRDIIRDCEENGTGPVFDSSEINLFVSDVAYVTLRYNDPARHDELTPLSHLGKKKCIETLAQYGISIPEPLLLSDVGRLQDIRLCLAELEKDINMESMFKPEFDEFFESLRRAVMRYNGMDPQNTNGPDEGILGGISPEVRFLGSEKTAEIPAGAAPYGAEHGTEGSLGYLFDPSGNIGPAEMRAVSDESFIILDQVNKALLFVGRDGVEHVVSLERCDRPKTFAVNGDEIAVLDSARIVIMNGSGETLRQIPLPFLLYNDDWNYGAAAMAFEFEDGILYWQTYSGKSFVLDEKGLEETEPRIKCYASGTNAKIASGFRTWTIAGGENIAVIDPIESIGRIYLIKKNEGILPDVTAYAGVCDSESTNSVFAPIETEGEICFPLVSMSPSGRVYMLTCLEDRAIISELIFGE